MASEPQPPAEPSPSSPGPARPRRERAPGAYLALALWQRYVVSGVVAIVLLIAMVLYVSHHNTNTNPTTNEATEHQANNDAEVLVEQDQAPRVVALSPGVAPKAAIQRAIDDRLASQIAGGGVSGPLQHTTCTRVNSAPGGLTSFRCSVIAGSVRYPFEGVVDRTDRRVTFCKHDPPPAPGDSVPVSARCTL
jgi:hypothetical protein